MTDDDRALVSVPLRDEFGELLPLHSVLRQIEGLVLREALTEHGFVRSEAAVPLAITTRTMYRLCKKHGLGRK